MTKHIESSINLLRRDNPMTQHALFVESDEQARLIDLREEAHGSAPVGGGKGAGRPGGGRREEGAGAPALRW